MTKGLRQMLDENKLDFAVIEGSPLCGKKVSIDTLLKETIVVREEGSGTRRIFEERLMASGYELSDFFRQVSISSFVSIKALVSAGIGISFLYHSVVDKEENIGTFHVDGLTEPHAFHVVYTRNTNARDYADQLLAGQSAHPNDTERK